MVFISNICFPLYRTQAFVGWQDYLSKNNLAIGYISKIRQGIDYGFVAEFLSGAGRCVDLDSTLYDQYCHKGIENQVFKHQIQNKTQPHRWNHFHIRFKIRLNLTDGIIFTGRILGQLYRINESLFQVVMMIYVYGILESIGYNRLIQILQGMSNAQMKAKKFYRQLLNKLEALFSKSAAENDIIDKFKSEILKQFKLTITFDDMMSQTLKDYSVEITENFIESEFFAQKVNFLDKLNNIMYKMRYISQRSYRKLGDIIQRSKSSFNNTWQEGLSYLKNSEDLAVFRYEFLIYYCDMGQDEVTQFLEQEINSEEGVLKLKKIYQDFFNIRCWQVNVKPTLITFIDDYFSQFENKSQMLSQQTIKKLQKKLGGAVGATNDEIKINTMLVDIAQQNSYNNDQQIQQRLENQIKNIEKVLKKFSGLNLIKEKGLTLRIGKFGSLISGFAGTDADLDLTILTNCYVNQTQFLQLLISFLRKEYKEQDKRGGRRVVADVIAAKIPLIVIKISQRGKQDLKIDLIVNNILGVINSKFLKVYSKIRWIKNLGLLVKLWGKSVQLISKNALSSYAMILMLIHYLIKEKKIKAIMDHRVITNQTSFFQYKRLKSNEVEQFKVYYAFKTQEKDVTSYERINYYKILKGFMKYYGHDIWKFKNQADRIITVDLSNDRQIDKECVITIKDPFDKPHNPGRLKIQSEEFFKQKFRDAHHILQKGQQSKIRALFRI